jgi:DNA-binding NtrC family response regulator
MPAYAAIGAAGPRSGIVTTDEPDDFEAAADQEEPEPEVPLLTAPAGSRLADVAKAAALKAERTIIEDSLTQVHWNRRRAAEQLGVSYKTLLNKIKECGISRR